MPILAEGAAAKGPSSPPNNLPLQLTSLVGRERELAAVCALLRRDDVRLLTLTGPPGIGKTRLAIEAARSLLADFSDGVYFVNLASVVDPDLVIATIEYTLGVGQVGDQSLLQSLVHFLALRQVLLVLDNFEQVVEAAPRLAELLKAVPRVKVLVTSRELLRISGEHNFSVPPLSLPPVLADQGSIRPLANLPSERIATYESVQLFTQRAAALNPDFALTESNALIVAGICSRLEGVPLSLELAAARIHHLPPQAILERLQNRLRLLTGGTQDLPARQRTLRATIEWSYNLLSVEEQLLFRRLAVFQGGATLAAIEAVCDAGGNLGIETLDVVTSLVDQSLLRSEHGMASGERAEHLQSGHPDSEMATSEPYYVMLETIHEYAREQLEATDEAAEIRRLHASYYLAFARSAVLQLRGPRQADWLNRLDQEGANFQAALDWLAKHDIEMGLQLAAILITFWIRRGHFSEGQGRLSAMLSRARVADTPPDEAMAHALYAAGYVLWHQGDMQGACPLLQESVRILRELRSAHAAVDMGVMAEAINRLGIVIGRLEGIDVRRGYHEEALSIAREIGDEWGVARSLYQLGHVSRLSGDYEQAQSLFRESLQLFRAAGDHYNIGLALIGSGLMAQQRGDYNSARSLFEECLAIYRALKVPWAVASGLYCLGSVVLDQGDFAGARSLLDESLVLQRELGIRGDIAEGLENLGRAAYFQGDYAASWSFYTESLSLFQESGDKYGMALCLMDLGGVMVEVARAATATSKPRSEGPATGHPGQQGAGEEPSRDLADKGTQLLGAGQALFEGISVQPNQTSQKLLDKYLAAARRQLGQHAYAYALATGRAMGVEAAVSQALAEPIRREVVAPAGLSTEDSSSQGSKPPVSNPLTRREREIAALIGAGKSNRAIADALVVSERTVEWHASNILLKLGLESRSQIAVWAVEQGLSSASR